MENSREENIDMRETIVVYTSGDRKIFLRSDPNLPPEVKRGSFIASALWKLNGSTVHERKAIVETRLFQVLTRDIAYEIFANDSKEGAADFINEMFVTCEQDGGLVSAFRAAAKRALAFLESGPQVLDENDKFQDIYKKLRSRKVSRTLAKLAAELEPERRIAYNENGFEIIKSSARLSRCTYSTPG